MQALPQESVKSGDKDVRPEPSRRLEPATCYWVVVDDRTPKSPSDIQGAGSENKHHEDRLNHHRVESSGIAPDAIDRLGEQYCYGY